MVLKGESNRERKGERGREVLGGEGVGMKAFGIVVKD